MMYSSSPSISAHEAGKCMAILLATNVTELRLIYLAEGAANVIYHVVSTDIVDSAHCRCCVLRLRKDLPFTQPCVEAFNAFRAQIVPLFTVHDQKLLLEQALFTLCPEMVRAANRELENLESSHSRQATRVGIYHPKWGDETSGILMPNLNLGSDRLLIEFKPKWLVQSPSAPRNATRCRTCALNAARRIAGKSKGRGDMGFCPLDLLNTDEKVLTPALSNIFSTVSAQLQTTLSKFTTNFKMKVQPALQYLQKLQAEHNNVGLDQFRDPSGQDFAIAMALRDCSVFLSVASATSDDYVLGDIVDVKFADLDLKSSQGGKLEKWLTTEKELITTGAYTRSLDADDCCSLMRKVQYIV